MGMKQLTKLAAEVEYYYDKSPRVRIFARAAGVLVCCEGGVCNCKCPDLLNAHMAAVGKLKEENKKRLANGEKILDINDDSLEYSIVSKPPISKTTLSTGRGITRFRKEMAEFWVDLVACAFGLPSSKKKTRSRSSSSGSKNVSNNPIVKQQEKDKLATVLGGGK
jgi:hypothetical protein